MIWPFNNFMQGRGQSEKQSESESGEQSESGSQSNARVKT